MRNIRAIVVMAVAFAVIAFLFRHEQGKAEIFGMAAAMIVLVLGTSAHRGTREFLASHTRVFFWVGIAITIATPFVAFGAAAALGLDPMGEDQAIFTVLFLGVMLVGVALISLPRGFRDQAKLAQRLHVDRTEDTAFNGPSEAWSALRSAPRHAAVFLRYAVPWVLLLSIIPRLTLAAGLARAGSGFHFFVPASITVSDATKLLWEQLPGTLLLAFIVPGFAVAWHRLALGDPRGRRMFAWPDRGAWSYFWRLAIMSSMLGTYLRMVVGGNARDLAGLLGTENVLLVAGVLYFATIVLFVFVVSSYALMFPAIAVEDWDRANLHASLAAMRTIGRSFGFGFVLAVLPYPILKLLLSDLLFRVFGSGDTPLIFVIGWGLQLLFFAGIASAAAYLSQAYLSARSREQTAGESYATRSWK